MHLSFVNILAGILITEWLKLMGIIIRIIIISILLHCMLHILVSVGREKGLTGMERGREGDLSMEKKDCPSHI